MHINVLERKACLLAVKSFVKNFIKKIINTLKSCLTIPQKCTVLSKWEHRMTSGKKLGNGKLGKKKTSASCSHSRAAKHSY